MVTIVKYIKCMILFLTNLICIIATLAEAQAKLPRAAFNSDLSTEDEVIIKNKKLSSGGLKNTKNNAPPLYKDVCSRS